MTLNPNGRKLNDGDRLLLSISLLIWFLRTEWVIEILIFVFLLLYLKVKNIKVENAQYFILIIIGITLAMYMFTLYAG